MQPKNILSIVFVILFFGNLFSQNNMGLGTTSPDPNAALDIVSTDKGILIPRITTTQRTTMAGTLTTTQNGLLVFDSDENKFYYWNATEWTEIGGGTGGGSDCFTLQEAYDCTTPGAGRAITANDGSVEITLSSTTTSTEALMVTATDGSIGTPSTAIAGNNTSFGVSIYGENDKTDNPYNSIHGVTASNNENTSAVAGYYDGSGQGVGVYGSVYYDNPGGGKAGIFGVNNRTDGGYGILGQGVNGVVGQTDYGLGFGVFGSNSNSIGANNGVGVIGDGNYGVWGQTSFGADGVFGLNTRTDGGMGVEGQGFNGVAGITVEGAGYGVYGENSSSGTTYNNIGVAGLGWVGVWGESLDGTGFGVYSNGELGGSGTKSFMIDHPMDPENKYLKHYSMESPEVLNVYRGNVVLDTDGNATVVLPEYFDAINIDFSYHLTAVGAPCPNLYVSREIENNTFELAGGSPGAKISWVVYAQRNDAYMQQNPNAGQVEVEKRDGVKGTYLMPELYGQPAEKKMIQPVQGNNIKQLLEVPVSGETQQTNIPNNE